MTTQVANTRHSRPLIVIAVSVTVLVVAILAYVALPDFLAKRGEASTSHLSGASRNLPKGCSKPASGYLIIASNEGFNDSILHGAPKVPWPVITVQKESVVNIVVCNIDTYPHGFQIHHYFDNNIETVAPGQVIRVSFVADDAGAYEIYCSILCPIHVFMQNAELIVGD